MIKKWNLVNLMYNNSDPDVDYGFYYTDENGDEQQLYDSSTFIDKIFYKYTSWCITSPGFFDTENNEWVNLITDIQGAQNMFMAMYRHWQDDKRPAFLKLYEALRGKYNPLWNVDGVTGIITEDTHTGTDTNAKTGDDTSKLSGVDATASSGSDINTLSGRDVDTLSGTDAIASSGRDIDTLSGTDTNRQSGTDTTQLSGEDVVTLDGQDVETLGGTDTDRLTGTDSKAHTGTQAVAHTGTVTTVKDITDGTSYDGKEINHKYGDEIVGEETTTYDSGNTFFPTKKITTHYPGEGEQDVTQRADVKEYDHRADSRDYDETSTDTHNNTDTTTFNDTEATTYGKVDTMSYGKTDTTDYGKEETTEYGKEESTTYGKTDAMTYGKVDTTQYGKTDTTTYGKTDTMSYGKVDTLQHGKTDTTTYGKQDKTTYNSTNTETKDLFDKHLEMQIRQGNIGVTMTQQLINAQIDLTSKDSLIDYMIADFIHTTCVI